MSYTPTNWQNGKTPINEINLNKMEQGIVEIDTTRNLHTYTHVSQIGLTDPQTVKEIIDVLPANSEIIFGVAAGSVLSNDTPLGGKPGEIRIIKTTTSNGGRGTVEIKRHNGSDIYSNHYHNGALIGWEKVVLNSDLERLNGIHNWANSIAANGSISITFSDYSTTLVSCGYGSQVGYYGASLILSPNGGIIPLKETSSITITKDETNGNVYHIKNNIPFTLRLTITSFRSAFSITVGE